MLLTRFASDTDGAKRIDLLGGTLTLSPVLGFRPTLCERLLTRNAPKPTMLTSSPQTSDSDIIKTDASMIAVTV